MLISRVIKEYTDNSVAYNETTLYIFGIPVSKTVNSTTNSSIVSQLKTEKHKIIKGYEVKNKGKENT